MLFRAWQHNQWPIATTQPKDEYGRERDLETNYLSDHVPDEYHAEGMAMQYVDVLRMPYYEVLDMAYDEFVKLTLLHKAVTMRRPAKFKSIDEYHMELTKRKHGLR